MNKHKGDSMSSNPSASLHRGKETVLAMKTSGLMQRGKVWGIAFKQWIVKFIGEILWSRGSSQIAQLKSEICVLKKELEQVNAYLENVIRIVPASIYWKDKNFIIRGSNLCHAKLAGFSDPKEVIGKTEFDFVWKNQASNIIKNDKKIMSLGKAIRLEEKATLRDGVVHTFLTSKEPLRNQRHEIIGIIGISIDITEQKESEKRARKAEELVLLAQSKANFEMETRKILMILVGDIVHDLRTPIATLRSVGDLLSSILPDVIEILNEAKAFGSQKLRACNPKKLRALSDNTI